MPKKFDTSRIYELPILRHNVEAIRLIHENATGASLSDEFLQKAVEHNTLLGKLIILDNIPIGCVYSHIESTDKETLIVDFVCVLKSYQKRGLGAFTIQKLIERAVKELSVKRVVALADNGDSKAFFSKIGFEENGEACTVFDGREIHGTQMVKRV